MRKKEDKIDNWINSHSEEVKNRLLKIKTQKAFSKIEEFTK